MTPPVVLFAFNRPSTTARVFARIREARPATLLLVSDGARADRPGEADKVAEVRRMLDLVDWPCDVRKHYAPSNMGCRKRISSGIAWAFSQVEEAIFLEDDTLPDPSFFAYCEELLARYRDDDRVLMISGYNMLGRGALDGTSYWWSAHPRIWGWAATRRAWQGYDASMTEWPAFKETAAWTSRTAAEQRAWEPFFDAVKRGAIDTWDAQVTLHAWRTGRVTAIPALNLVENIGFGAGATNTPSGYRMPEVEPMDFPMLHPAARVANAALDAEWLATEHAPPAYGLRDFLRSAWRKLAGAR